MHVWSIIVVTAKINVDSKIRIKTLICPQTGQLFKLTNPQHDKCRQMYEQ